MTNTPWTKEEHENRIAKLNTILKKDPENRSVEDKELVCTYVKMLVSKTTVPYTIKELQKQEKDLKEILSGFAKSDETGDAPAALILDMLPCLVSMLKGIQTAKAAYNGLVCASNMAEDTMEVLLRSGSTDLSSLLSNEREAYYPNGDVDESSISFPRDIFENMVSTPSESFHDGDQSMLDNMTPEQKKFIENKMPESYSENTSMLLEICDTIGVIRSV